MKVTKAYKVRLYPNKTQEKAISCAMGCARFIWNSQVSTFNSYSEENPNPVYKSLNQLKSEYEWLNDVSCAVLQQKLRDFEQIKRQFFDKKRKKRLGTPNFHKRGKNDSFRLPNQKFKVIVNKIQLEKIGKVKAVFDREFPEDTKFISVTVSRSAAGKYFASISFECEVLPLPRTGKEVGIDLGLKEFAVTSDNLFISNPRYFRKNQAKIARLQLFQAKKRGSKKGESKSRRWLKLQRRINSTYERLTNQRKHFLHEVSTSFVRNYDTICIEDLNVSGMMKNHKLAKSIGDVSWSEFRKLLTYKCEWYGKKLVVVGRFEPTSKTCSCCGWYNPDLTLKDRVFACPVCLTTQNRDFNAAKNIKTVGVSAVSRTQRGVSSSDPVKRLSFA